MRTVADVQNGWGSILWSGPAGTAPFNGTWGNPDVPASTTAMETILNTDPAGGEGVSVGPHAGDLRFVVEALNPLLGGSSLWSGGNWGTERWSSSAGGWQDISSLVRGISWTQGADTPDGTPAVGTATITIENLDGAASPWVNAGTFAAPGARSWLRAGLLVRFGVLSASLGAGMPVPLDNYNSFLTGRVESIVESTSENVDGWVQLTVAETTADLSANSDAVQLVNGQTVSQSLLKVLNAAGTGFQADLVVPDEDGVVQATTVGSLGTQAVSVSSTLQLIADSLHWAICSDGRGKVMAIPRHVVSTDMGITFSNNPAGAEMPLVGIHPFSNLDRVLNQAAVARIGGALQTVNDTASQLQFGTISERYGCPRSDLVVNTDAQALFLASRLVTLYSDDDLGIEGIDLDMDMDSTNLPSVLTYLSTLGRAALGFTIRWVHPSGHVYTEFVTMTRCSQSITMEGSQLKWTANLTVERAVSQDI